MRILILLLALMSASLPGRAGAVNDLPGPVALVLNQPQAAFFTVSRDSTGHWYSKNALSYYATSIDDPRLGFSVGNGALAAAVAPNGELLQTCTFGKTYPSPGYWPGKWVTWDKHLAGPVRLTIETHGSLFAPEESSPCTTSYLINVLPLTTYTTDSLQIRVICCPSVSADGVLRPRGLIWGIAVRNVSQLQQVGAVDLAVPASITLTGVGSHNTFNLKPGEEVWIPAELTNAGDDYALSTMDLRNAAAWLTETCMYWKRITGTFSMPDDPFTGEMFVRKMVTSLRCPVFDDSGGVAGVEVGTYPFEGSDNFRDFYYGILPVAQRDPQLLQPLIGWFAQYAARPADGRYHGGISHSLGNSLNAVVLAGLYYNATADRNFFLSNPALVQSLSNILDQVVATRQPGGPWLFPSLYISDGRSLGSYHTGSNVCAWSAFKNFARILRDTGGDPLDAIRYEEVARNIKIALNSHNIKNGPFGQQYVEGTDSNGTVPVSIHDGEESDTSLMPFYGYCAPDAPAYLNFMRFAASTNNVAYCPQTLGIEWENYGPNASVQPVGDREADATFPGYVTALAGCTEGQTLRGQNGALTELRRLTDVNGMWWWWPYAYGAERGHVRRFPMESVWAEGQFAALFVRNFLGIDYDAPTCTFNFSPLPATGDFDWEKFPIGFDTFSVKCRNGRVQFTNLSNHVVTLRAEMLKPVQVLSRSSVVMAL